MARMMVTHIAANEVANRPGLSTQNGDSAASYKSKRPHAFGRFGFSA